MRYRHHLGVDEESLPKEAYEEICALAPSARKHYGFHLQLDTDASDGGEIVRRIIAICSQHGLARRRTVGRGAYGHYADRSYGDNLFDFDMLMLNRQVIARMGVRDSRFVGAADPAWRAGSLLGFSQQVVVDGEVRRLLEQAKFIGLQFGGSPVYPERLGALTADEWLAAENASQRSGILPGPFWELKTSIVLPKIATPLMEYGLRGAPPRPFEGDYSRPVFIDDPPFSKGEAGYRRGEINELGPFDIARTFEKYMGPEPALVISQRFYRYCLANEIGVNVDPVHVDAE